MAFEGEIDGEREPIIVYRAGNRVDAWLNVCPHQGRRLDYVPGKFLIDRGNLVCAAHGASFELPTGRCVAGPCVGSSLRRVRIEAVDADALRVLGLEPAPGIRTDA